MEILGKYSPEEYASFWGCDPVYDKPPRKVYDGLLFYNFGSEKNTKESLTKFLGAIDRTIEEVKLRPIQDDIDAKEDKEDIQGLSELKDYVQSLLDYQNQKNTSSH